MDEIKYLEVRNNLINIVNHLAPEGEDVGKFNKHLAEQENTKDRAKIDIIMALLDHLADGVRYGNW